MAPCESYMFVVALMIIKTINVNVSYFVSFCLLSGQGFRSTDIRSTLTIGAFT